jgi:HD-GYP domain-containing protein (c-di-GMP phosphodiesterase class II)
MGKKLGDLDLFKDQAVGRTSNGNAAVNPTVNLVDKFGKNDAGLASLLSRLQHLNELGTLLSAERDQQTLLESFLLGAKSLTNADGGTLYTIDDSRNPKALNFEIVRTDSLGLRWGGPNGDPIQFPPVPLFDYDGRPNHQTVVAHAVLSEKTVVIDDAYAAEGFDFSGTRKFDKQSGYRSQSFLVAPLKDHDGHTIGALQLINRQREGTKEVIPFNETDQQIVESLASQAAVSMTNRRLIDDLNKMVESLIAVIADAIDQKSPYTGKHCQRVPEVTMMLANALNRCDEGPFRDFNLDREEMNELRVAAWLHDCGKVVTPVHVVDKSTRLETIFDRIELINLRIEILRRDAMLQHANNEISEDQIEQRLGDLDDDYTFICECNKGGHHVDNEDERRLIAIADRCWRDRHDELQGVVSEDELNNLQISRGTLNNDEREVIKDHVKATIQMLEKLPFPRHLSRVPEIAAGHHERMDGKGYPNGVTGDELSVQARLLAISDIFEALTSGDRPYKKAIPLSKAIEIMERMRDDGHVDADILEVFIKQKVYLQFAREHMPTKQVDLV